MLRLGLFSERKRLVASNKEIIDGLDVTRQGSIMEEETMLQSWILRWDGLKGGGGQRVEDDAGTLRVGRLLRFSVIAMSTTIEDEVFLPQASTPQESLNISQSIREHSHWDHISSSPILDAFGAIPKR
jgi:hypothetical protein